MYKYLNVNPQGKHVGDCVKRALTTATGLPYDVISLALNRYKKKNGAKSFNEWNENVVPFMEERLGAEKKSFPAVKGMKRMDGETFCKMYSKGNYVLQFANHVSACIDGVIYDTWNPSSKCVYTAHKINPKYLDIDQVIKKV